MFGGIPKDELKSFDQFWRVFPSLKDELFTGDSGYLSLHTDNIKDTIRCNEDVRRFCEHYKAAFSDFGDEMDRVLIDQAETLSVPRTEEELAASIFKRFKDIPLLDPYQAYEIFEGAFPGIAGDLELIQTEGMKAVTQVDPNMVVKKKNGKDVEVQEGWKGHILPFDLVERICLKDALNALTEKENELAEIPSSYDELIESLSEDDKDSISEALNDTNDAFAVKNIKGVIKTLKEDGADNKTLIQTLRQAESLNEKEKRLKAEIKSSKDSLHLKTKATIESLTEAQIRQLLHEKWAAPIETGILSLADSMVDAFTKNIEMLAGKYSVTMSDLEEKIRDTEDSLSTMLSDLTGTEADMAGIRELQKLLGGEAHE
jgi:type I restriction enzyme M protein